MIKEQLLTTDSLELGCKYPSSLTLWVVNTLKCELYAGSQNPLVELSSSCPQL